MQRSCKTLLILCLALCVAMLGLFAACGKTKTDDDSIGQSTVQSTEQSAGQSADQSAEQSTEPQPEAPTLEKSEYSYDRAVGGKFELPVELNGGILYLVKNEGENIRSDYYSYNGDSGCVELDEEYMLGLEKRDYSVQIITTGGSAEFTLFVVNSINTSFDEMTDKSVALGKADGVFFSVNFNGTTVKAITYGDYTLTADEYEASEDGVTVKEDFYAKTYRDDERVYTLTLSNNESYEFSITTNVIFFSDYDLTTIHDELINNVGWNSLYQDSTRVELIEAPEGSGFFGRVLKYEPHTEDVLYNTHGIYTLEQVGSDSTWRKVSYVAGKTYIVSFDYMTVGTTAEEDFRYRSYNGLLMGEKIDTGRPGEKLHYSYSFVYDDDYIALFLYGKFINGGYILIDNYSFVESDTALPQIVAETYTYSGDYTAAVTENGYIVKGVLIDGAPVEYTYENGTLTIVESVMAALTTGEHELALVTGAGNAETLFTCEDPSLNAILTETSKSFENGAESLKLAGEFVDGITVTALTRQGTSLFDSAYYEPKSMSADYITVEEDGIVISKALLDQVYATCTYKVTFSNGVNATFTLTSDMLFYSNYDETELWHDGIVPNYAYHREWPAEGMVALVSDVEGFDGKVLRYTPSGDNWFIRIITMNNAIYTSYDWTPLTVDEDEYYEFFFDYEIIAPSAPTYGFYYTTKVSEGETLMDNTAGKKHFSIKMKGSDFSVFAVGYWPGDVQGCVMYIDNYGVRRTEAPSVDTTVTAVLTDTAKEFANGTESLKLAGEFDDGVTVTSLTRQGTSPFDNAYSTPKAMSLDYVTVTSDGIVLSKGLLDQVYATCTYYITFSNGAEYTFTLTSDMLFYSNYDETELWHNGIVPDYAYQRENDATNLVGIAASAEGFDGKVLKYSPDGASWYVRIITLQKAPLSDPWWTPVEVEDDEYYEIFFDYEIISPTPPVQWGFLYVINYQSGEQHMDNSAGKHHFSIKVKGSDFICFGIGYFCGDVDGATMYIDNFGMRKTTAPA